MEDIKTIKFLDETVNQRVIVIRGEENIKERLNIVTSADKNMSYYHSSYLKKYLETEYLEDLTLQSVQPRISPVDGLIAKNIICYLTQKYNDIIFTETTQDNSNERVGIFYFPNQINKEQYDIALTLMPYFEKFESVLIQKSFINNGIIMEAEENDLLTNAEIYKLKDYFENMLNVEKQL